MNKFKIKQWHTLNDIQEAIDEFDGNIQDYFNHHLNQIKEDGKYSIFNSWVNEDSFYIELDEGKFHNVKCTAEIL